ncbi:hypothetical protein C2S51_038053 [Perilla frutescens var. frutescens]|nr:hypothetical protein C2S51_038053 [Perilla frutescens var. frutescens]
MVEYVVRENGRVAACRKKWLREGSYLRALVARRLGAQAQRAPLLRACNCQRAAPSGTQAPARAAVARSPYRARKFNAHARRTAVPSSSTSTPPLYSLSLFPGQPCAVVGNVPHPSLSSKKCPSPHSSPNLDELHEKMWKTSRG